MEVFYDILQSGICLIPVGNNKKVTLPEWKQYQERTSTQKELAHWLKKHNAFAAVCGAVSGGLGCLDFDDNSEAKPRPYTADEFWAPWWEKCRKYVELYNLPVQRTRGNGFQIYYRCDNPGGNSKFAWVPDATKETGRAIAIEDRGQGGYAVIAPSFDGAYHLLRGSFTNIARIPQEIVDIFWQAARDLDLMPVTVQDIAKTKQGKLQHYNGTSNVFEAFNAAHNVRDLLLKYGYTGAAEGKRLVRPNGHSGSVAVIDSENISFHWSSNDPLHRPNGAGNPLPVDPFDAYAFFEHGDDKKAAVKAAAQQLGISLLRTENASNAAPMVGLEDVLAAIKVIADKGQIIQTLSQDIGALEKSQHLLVIDALGSVGFTKGEARQFVAACAADARARQRAERDAAAYAQRRENAIQVNDRQLSDVVSDTLDALQASNDDPTLFVRGGVLVRVVADENGQKVISEVDNAAMLGILSDVACWQAITETDKGERARDVYPPREVITAILGRGSWSFPGLLGIVSAPTVGKDGTIHADQGYSPKTRLYFTGGIELGDTRPLPNNVEWAKSLILDDLLIDFPFRDDASKAHAVSYMITPFVRDLIDGPTPPHMVDAPSAGTGKGLLINACAMAFLGHDAPSMPSAKDDDEWRKRITTALMAGNTHLVIDNVNTELDSGSLASAWTQPVWHDRTLGSNRQVSIPIRTLWAITANNVKMSQELARRCLWIRIDANSEKPWMRTGFKHDNLIAWAKEHRADLVTAVFILINAWLEAGRPLYYERVKGSYEVWARVVGGILQTVGIPGFLENEDELYQNVVSRDDTLTDFVKHWIVKQQKKLADGFEGALSAGELFKLASISDNDVYNQSGEYLDLLGDLLGAGNERSRKTRLGFILNEHRDKVIAGHKIKYDKSINGMKYWRLQPMVEDLV